MWKITERYDNSITSEKFSSRSMIGEVCEDEGHPLNETELAIIRAEERGVCGTGFITFMRTVDDHRRFVTVEEWAEK